MTGRVASALRKPSAANSPAIGLLQRKCACGTHTPGGGECAACAKKRRAESSPRNRYLAVGQSGDRFEQEADRMAALVMNERGTLGATPFSSAPRELVQRDDDGKPEPPKPNNYDEAAKKIVDALQATTIGKQLKAKAEELGNEFLASVEGKVVAGGALGSALAVIIATNSKLPVQIPEIPLDFIKPGLKAKLTYEGPVRDPTNVGLTLTSKSGISVSASYSQTAATHGKPAERKAGLTLTIPLGGSPTKSKPKESDSDKFRAETARMAEEQRKFQEGLKTPAQKAQDKADQQRFIDAYLLGHNPLDLHKKDDLMLMRKATTSSNDAGVAPEIVHEALAGSGHPLDPDTRAFMEERFGHDFSHVRIHTDAKAAESAHDVGAHAYTVGPNIVFGSGQFAPLTHTGRHLLAHELTHVVQQGSGASSILQRDQGSNQPQPAQRIDVAIVFGDEGLAMVEARSYAPTVLRVTSGEDAKKQLLSLGKPLGRIYVVSHSNRAGEVEIVSSIGTISWVKLSDLSKDLKGIPGNTAPTDIDFRGCKLGDAPQEMETFRQNIGAQRARGMTCWSFVATASPLTLDGTELTDPGQVPQGMQAKVDAALVKQINSLKSDNDHPVKDCIEGLLKGETAASKFAKVKQLYFEHKGNLSATWASPEYNRNWQRGSMCVKDLTDQTSPCKFTTVTAPAVSPPANQQVKK